MAEPAPVPSASPGPAAPKLLSHRLRLAASDHGPTPPPIATFLSTSPAPAEEGNAEAGKANTLALADLSWPPTTEELHRYKAIPPSQLPRKFRRDPLGRIFVNRDLRLDKINYYGFDMDYTLAIYNSPHFEELSYRLMLHKLVEMGYPAELKELKFDASFPIRGLFLDKQMGNFLKVDSYGTIATCVHGRTVFEKKKIVELYPGMRVVPDAIGSRYYLINTLFSVPEACLYSDLVVLLESMAASKKFESEVSYSNIFNDLRIAMDFVHLAGSLKQETLDNLPRYIRKEPKLAQLLCKIREAGKKSFLLTNSEWYYTEKVMTYLLDKDWRSYFTHVIVNANKPKFFEDGTTLREVDPVSGQLHLGPVKAFLPGRVYSGGSLVSFQRLAGIPSGEQVLYIGDHIFADIIRSKKTHGWRTLLVVPELAHDIVTWKQNAGIYHRLLNLEWIRAEVFRDQNADITSPPDLRDLRREITKTREDWNRVFNAYFGSLFRSGSKQSFFSMQVLRYADLYTTEYTNLLNYPFFYFFASTTGFAPHENEYRGSDYIPQ